MLVYLKIRTTSQRRRYRTDFLLYLLHLVTKCTHSIKSPLSPSYLTKCVKAKICFNPTVRHFHMSNLAVFQILKKSRMQCQETSNSMIVFKFNILSILWKCRNLHLRSTVQTETWLEHTHSFVHTTVFVHSTLQECKCMSSQWAGDALYTVKVIWADSTGRAPTVWLPHGGPGCHRNRPTSHDSSACQPGQSLTLLGNHPGKVDRKRKKTMWPWQLYSSASLTRIQRAEHPGHLHLERWPALLSAQHFLLFNDYIFRASSVLYVFYSANKYMGLFQSFKAYRGQDILCIKIHYKMLNTYLQCSWLHSCQLHLTPFFSVFRSDVSFLSKEARQVHLLYINYNF